MKSEAVERIEVAPGIFAAIYYDESPGNPWKEWDCNPPLLAYSDRSLTPYGEEVTPGDLLDMIPAYRFRSRPFQDAILDALNLERETILWDRKNYPGTSFRDAVLDRAGEGLSKEYRTQYLDGLEALAKFAKVPTYRGTARGSCQGDWAELLLFALPADKDTRFNGADPVGSLESSFDLWESWAFGNVYGYILEDADGEKLEYPDGEGVTSCWGFYGYDHKASGLIEDATSAAAYYVGALAEENRESFDAACRDIVTV
jgi:hypothetical protein